LTKRKSGTEYSKIQDKINKKVGKIGEDAACKYLTAHGWRIVERNFRYRRYEIDIIAVNDRYIIFTEVKTRSSVEFGSPSQAVTLNKRVCIRAGAEGYLKRNCYNLYPRFDVIEVVVNNNDLKVESVNHIDNAFDINARVIR